MTRRTPVDPAPPLVLWRAGTSGHRTWSGPEWAALTGQGERDSHGLGWLGALYPDDRQNVRDAWLAASASGPLVIDHRIRTADGVDLRYRSSALPDEISGDAAQTWSGSSVLIEDLAAALEQRDVLLGALQHRVRNTLGSVRSMARLSLHGGESAEDYAAGLDGRIGAMARVQAELIRNPLARTDLAQLVAGELAMVTVREGGRVSIDGPVIHLRARAAETMGLALHELTTNALRHGALSRQDGTIEIRWQRDGEGDAARLRFEWDETAPNAVPQGPQFRGFGSQMLESILPYQLGAATGVRLGPNGLHVRIDLPTATCVLPPE